MDGLIEFIRYRDAIGDKLTPTDCDDAIDQIKGEILESLVNGDAETGYQLNEEMNETNNIKGFLQKLLN